MDPLGEIDARRAWVAIQGRDEILQIENYPEYLNDSVLLWLKKLQVGKKQDKDVVYTFGDLLSQESAIKIREALA